jgi:hypothetical protein
VINLLVGMHQNGILTLVGLATSDIPQMKHLHHTKLQLNAILATWSTPTIEGFAQCT